MYPTARFRLLRLDRSRTFTAMLVPLLLAACAGSDPVSGPDAADNRFAGCYDNGCLGAPALVSGVPEFTSVTSGRTHSCGLTASGEAWCWGDNTRGALGDGTGEMRNTPVRVAGTLQFAAIAAGGNFTCGVTRDQAAYCWGGGATGQLAQPGPERCGQGGEMCVRQPLRIPGLQGIAIAAGTRHACALDTTGAAVCWGFNMLGETGSTSYLTTVASPRRLESPAAFVAIGAGYAYTCARTAEGRAYCWGSADRGELGRPGNPCTSVAGFTNFCSATPAPVNTGATFTTLTVGFSHSCGITSSGSALCWGDNGQGQLGTGDFRTYAAPVNAQAGKSFSAIAATGAATCGTLTGGTSVCWGLNLWGKLGIGQRLELSTTPRDVAGAHRFASFAAGQDHVCALTSSGSTYCWGLGVNGQLGAGPRSP